MREDEILKARILMKSCNEAIVDYMNKRAKNIREGKPKRKQPMESGRLRRLSMDLTRQLAVMRASK